VFEQLLPNLYPKVGEHSYVQYDNLMITLFSSLSPLPIFSESNDASMPFSSFSNQTEISSSHLVEAMG
jgi:hypothetical protein